MKSKRSLSGRTAEPAWLDVLAEHLPQRLVEEMRRRVVRHRREPHRPRDDRADAIAGGEALALEDEHLVVADPVRLAQRRRRARLLVDELAGVGHLAAAGGVERRLAQLREEEPLAELLERADLGEDVGLGVADELAREAGAGGEVGGALRARLGACPRDLAVAAHLLAVAVRVDALAALGRELDGQLDREAVGRGEPECVRAADRLASESSSNSLSPRSSVSEKRSSSARTTRSIVSACSTTSGYHGADLLDDDRRQPVHVPRARSAAPG